MTVDKVFLDSNLLIYLVDNDIAKGKKVISLTTVDCIISTQVVAENINVCLRKLNLSYNDSIDHGKGLLENYNLVLINSSTLRIACTLLEKYKFSFWDTLIISSAIENNCSILYSEDMQHNQLIEGKLRIVNPFRG